MWQISCTFLLKLPRLLELDWWYAVTLRRSGFVEVVVVAPQRELEPSQHLVQLLGEYLCIVERDGRRSKDGLAAFEATPGSSSNRPSVRRSVVEPALRVVGSSSSGTNGKKCLNCARALKRRFVHFVFGLLLLLLLLFFVSNDYEESLLGLFL